MKIIDEFKTFATRGSAVEMMVGIVVGAGFNGLIGSFVRDILNPPLGLITGQIDLSKQVLTIIPATESREAVFIGWGQFVTLLIDFVLIAIVVFLFVKLINAWREESATKKSPDKATKNCKHCFSVISKKATKCPNCTADNP